MQDFGAQEIANTLHVWRSRGTKRQVHFCWRLSDRSTSAGAGAAGGGDIRGVQLAGCCKHAVGVCDDGEKARGVDDGAAGGAGGGDIRGVQLEGGSIARSTSAGA
jgi:hypothetical protein